MSQLETNLSPNPVYDNQPPVSYGPQEFMDALVNQSGFWRTVTGNSNQGTIERLKDFFNPSSVIREEGFNPYKSLIDMGRDDLLTEAYELSRIENQTELDAFLADRKQVDRDAAIFQDAGVPGLAASLAFGLTDPVNAIPIGQIAYSARAGENILKAGLAAARAGAVSSAINEGLLSANDSTRTAKQSIENITNTALLSGVIGGGVSLFANTVLPNAKVNFKEFADKFDENIRSAGPGYVVGDVELGNSVSNKMLSLYETNGSVGAMINPETIVMETAALNSPEMTLQKIENFGGMVKQTNPVFNFLYKLSKGATPIDRLLNSPIEAVRGLARMIGNDSLEMEGNAPKPLIRFGNEEQRYVSEMILHTDSLDKIRADFLKANPDYSITIDQWMEDVVNAARRKQSASAMGEVSPGVYDANISVSDAKYNEAVNAAADKQNAFMAIWEKRRQEYRAKQMAGVKDGTVDIYDPELDTNNYVMRAKFSREKVFRDAEGFRNVVREKFYHDMRPQETGVAVAGRDNSNSLVPYKLKYDPDIEKMVDEFVEKVQGGHQPNTKEGQPAHMAKRDFFTPEWIDRFSPYLDTNLYEANYLYARKMGSFYADIDTFGARGLKGWMDDIFGENGDMKSGAAFNELRVYREQQNDMAKHDKAKMQLEQNYRDLKAIYQSMTGTWEADATNPLSTTQHVREAVAGVRAAVSIMKMGASGLSVLPEVANSALAHGFSLWAKGAVPVFQSQLKKILGAAERGELDIFSGAVSHIKAGLHYNLMNTTESEFVQNKLVKGLQKFASKVVRYSGNLQVNDYAKNLSSTISLMRIEEIGAKAVPLEKDLAFLRNIGLTIDDVKGFKFNEGNVPLNIRRAVQNGISITSVNPSPELMPIFMNTVYGQLIGQFKAFLFSANRNMLLAGMQRADANVATGAMAMIVLGGMSNALRDAVTGKVRTKEQSPQDFIYSAVQQSGLTAIPGFAVDILGLPALLGVQNGRARYVEDNLLGNLLGPAAGMAQGIVGSGVELLVNPNPIDRFSNAKTFSSAIVPVAPFSNVIKDKLTNELSK